MNTRKIMVCLSVATLFISPGVAMAEELINKEQVKQIGQSEENNVNTVESSEIEKMTKPNVKPIIPETTNSESAGVQPIINESIILPSKETVTPLIKEEKGTYGTSAWKLDKKGVLHVYSGELPDTPSKSPWISLRSDINKVSLEGSILASENAKQAFLELFQGLRVDKLDRLKVKNNLPIPTNTLIDNSKTQTSQSKIKKNSANKNQTSSVIESSKNEGKNKVSSKVPHLSDSRENIRLIDKKIETDKVRAETRVEKGIELEKTEIIIKQGEVWDPRTNIISAYYEEGAELKDVTADVIITDQDGKEVTGTMGKESGEFVITYSYKDLEPKNVTVDVRARTVDLQLKETPPITPGSEWKPEANIASATDEYGKDVSSQVKVKEVFYEDDIFVDTVNTSVPGVYTVVYEYSDEYITVEKSTKVTVDFYPVVLESISTPVKEPLKFGSEWDPSDNFGGGTDKMGKDIDFYEDGVTYTISYNQKKVETVDTTKPGVYNVTYAHQGKKSAVAKVIVDVRRVELVVKDSQIGMGEDWDPIDNIVSCTDKDGVYVNPKNVKSSGNVNTTVPGVYPVKYTYDGVSQTAQVTVTEQLDGNLGSSTWYVRDKVLHIGTKSKPQSFPNTTGASPWGVHNKRISKIVFDGQVVANESLKGLFSGLDNVTSIEGFENFDTTNTTDMSSMFKDCRNLTDLNNFTYLYTGKVTNMNSMFSGTSSLKEVDLSNFHTEEVTDMGSMFSGNTNLASLDLSEFDTSKVSRSVGMFSNTNLGTVDFGKHFKVKEDPKLGKPARQQGGIDYWIPVSAPKAGSNDPIYTVKEMNSGLIAGSMKDKYQGALEPVINAHDIELYAGEKWDKKDNFDNATDYRGNKLGVNNLKFEGKVDTKLPGEYPISYTYGDTQKGAATTKEVNVIVKQNQAALVVHDSDIIVGDKWKAEDNIDLERSLDKEGNALQTMDNVKVEGTVNTDKAGTYTVKYSHPDLVKTESVKVVVKADQTAVNVHNSDLYLGADWKAEDNFDSAIDRKGEKIPFEEVEVKGDENVNTDKVGEYKVSYTYSGKTETAVIKVKEKENKTALHVHDSTLIIGETTSWKPIDNFDGCSDKDGNRVSFDQVTVVGKVDVKEADVYEVTYSYGDVSEIVRVTVKEKEYPIEINVHDSTVFVGSNWEAEHNFDSCYDIHGTEVEYDQVRVNSKVDIENPGTYKVKYTFEGVSKEATVNVIERIDKSEINVHDSKINIGDDWFPKQNFDSAIDKDGKNVTFDKITVEGQVDTDKKGTYEVKYKYGTEVNAAYITVAAKEIDKDDKKDPDKDPDKDKDKEDKKDPAKESDKKDPAGTNNSNAKNNGAAGNNAGTNGGAGGAVDEKTNPIDKLAAGLPQTGELKNYSFGILGGVISSITGYLFYKKRK